MYYDISQRMSQSIKGSCPFNPFLSAWKARTKNFYSRLSRTTLCLENAVERLIARSYYVYTFGILSVRMKKKISISRNYGDWKKDHRWIYTNKYEKTNGTTLIRTTKDPWNVSWDTWRWLIALEEWKITRSPKP